MKKLLAKFSTNEFLKGGVIVTVTSVFANFLNYLFNVLAGRYLGPVGYGEIYSLFSYITVLSIPTVILGTIIIQRIGSREGSKEKYAGALERFMIKKLYKLIPFFIAALLISPFLSHLTNLGLFTNAVLIPLIILTLLASIYTSLLNGLKLFFVVSLVTLLATLLKLLGALSIGVHLGGVGVVILFVLISGIFSFLGSRWAFRSHLKKSFATDEKPIERRVLEVITSPQFIVTSLSVTAITAFSNIDIMYAKRFFSAEEAGIYSSWSLFSKGIFYVFGPILSVSYIFFAHNQNSKQRDKSFLLSLVILGGLGLLSYIFYSNFASILINVFFGSEFAAVIPYLGAASIFGSLCAIIAFTNNFFLARNSRWSLILPCSLPLYIIGLFFLGREITSLYFLNNVYGFVIVLAYITAFFVSRK